MTAPCLTFGPADFVLRLSPDHAPDFPVDEQCQWLLGPCSLDGVVIRITDPSSSQKDAAA